MTESLALREAVRVTAPEWAVLMPGMTLRAYRGTVGGTPSDFMMSRAGDLVILSETIRDGLRARGVEVPHLLPVELTSGGRKKQRPTGCGELEVLVGTELAASTFGAVQFRCDACGASRQDFVEYRIAADAPWPVGMPMWRPRNSPATALVTGECRAAMLELGMPTKMFFLVRRVER